MTRGLVRRAAVGALLFACALPAAALSQSARVPHRPNPIVVENRKPGTARWADGTDWQNEVAGYASALSVLPGDSLPLHVSISPAGLYRIEVYRLGWYQGMGGTLYTCLPSCADLEPGTPQPTPAFDPATGLLDAGWPVTDTLRIGANWLSGYYLAVVRVPDRNEAYRIPFIVRAPASRKTPILVQASTNTWEAYNAWGGRSLYYPDMTGVTNNHVSANRPFDTMPMSDGSQTRYELPLVMYLEHAGFNVSYQTDADTDAAPGSLLAHRLVVVAGHSEYWSQGERQAFDDARANGINLAFMGANIGYWRIRYEDNRQTVVEYRSLAQDPLHITDKFRRLTPALPECQLEGVQFDDNVNESSIGSVHPLTVSTSGGRWFAHTGMKVGDQFANLMGGEWDHTVPACSPLTTQVLFSYDGPPSNGESVTYTADSGARVFAAASLLFNFALADPPGFTNEAGWQSPAIQRFVRNMFADLSARPSRK